jgi:membrane protein DedA with SNARE-associated domain
VVLTRPVPLVAEATAIMAGGAGMDWRTFLVAAGSGNLAIALVWTLAGSLGRQADSLQWAVVAALVVPVALTWLVLRRSLQTPSGGV